MICAALCDCLTVVVSRVPRAVLVLQASRLMSIHRTLLERHSKNLSIQKSVMSSLSKVVPCLDRSSANSVRVLLGVLIPTMVHRRKRRLTYGRTHCRRCFEDGVPVRTQERDVPSGRGDGVEGRGGAAQGGRHGVGSDGLEDPFQEAGRSGCGSSVSDTVSLCGDDADAAGGWLCFVQSILPRLRKFLTIRLPQISAMACDALGAVFDPNSAAQLEKEAVEEISLASLQHVEGTPTDSRELSLAFVETVDAGLALLQDQDRTLSLETLSCILPCLLKQVRSTTGRERRANARPLYSVAFRASRIVSLNARCAFSRDSFTLSVSDPLRHSHHLQLPSSFRLAAASRSASFRHVEPHQLLSSSFGNSFRETLWPHSV